MIGGYVMDFGGSGTNTYHYMNLLTITTITVVLTWILLRPYAVDDINTQLGGLTYLR